MEAGCSLVFWREKEILRVFLKKEEETIKRKQKTGGEKGGNEKELKLTGSSSSIPLEILDSD